MLKNIIFRMNEYQICDHFMTTHPIERRTSFVILSLAHDLFFNVG